MIRPAIDKLNPANLHLLVQNRIEDCIAAAKSEKAKRRLYQLGGILSDRIWIKMWFDRENEYKKPGLFKKIAGFLGLK